ADQVIRVLAPGGGPTGGEGVPVPGVSGSGVAAAPASGPAGTASSGFTGLPGVVWVAAVGSLLGLAAGGALSLRRRQGRSVG
ncbi:MAG: hypothetical protein LBJ02_10025, partial [Bifidobacteriaceae bacterium]|nr:hypothetical protein [Bifidobacteriaceae bacterium]